ncbi:D-aminoacyl-tRNA deacylase 1-like isoform X1 [Homalodisca vitripennis]|uniref:D-aminoacyl-tRNA deacylase n=2 Tax=Homalodisca TaxID=139475 RepID=A0A1B6HT41_9HEMI|nr:D-aminoacyl-tRNA deacylase 1-like isoform X1 [Homalodisca vitripennis]KAG8327447.1 D-tyrosyl-tRNA(Tyr) deacylase [Homalodisca vitripennis]
MKALIQNVNKTKVSAGGAFISVMGPGLLVFLGLYQNDTERDADYIVDTVLNAQLFEEIRNDTPKAKPVKWVRNVMEKGYEVTCLAEISLVNTLKGGTPSFGDAMDVEKGHRLYQYVINSLGHKYHEDKIKQSKFLGPHLVDVHLTNGITVYLETPIN